MRRAASIGVVLALAAAAPAHADRIVTLTTQSRFVNPATEQFNAPPKGEPARPKELRVNVFIPNGYERGGKFPVLYLLHGHGDSYSSWASPNNGDLLNVARGFPGLIVMPEAAQGWYTNWWHGGRRGDPQWESYYLGELLPLIEKRFRIRRGRRWHAIAGLSMGGEGAAYLAEQRPGYFGSMASFSGPLSIQRPEYARAGMDTQGQKFTDVFGPPDGFYATAHNPAANTINLQQTRSYVTVGNGTGTLGDATNYFGTVAEADLNRHAEDFVAAAQADKVDVTYVPRNGVHDWPYWREHLKAAIEWGFFGKATERVSEWTFRTAAQFGEAWGFRYRFATAPNGIVTFKRAGNRISATGAGSVSVRAPNGRRFRATLPFDRAIPKRKRGR